MVFESIVVDLINKYLGDYVENLDRSQLKLGIWGGDAVLQNLELKESALDDLDLPVKIKAGHIGKLTLKIPWKNLYTEPVIASIDGLYALAVPNVAVKYNEEKEEKAKQEAKQKKLQQIEDAKKLEAEKDKPQEVKKDSFAEKMAAQIIKNLQIQVMNVHVRYEDKFSNPKRPFSIGVSLKELQFQTTDENWKPCIIKEAVTQIFKLIKLDSLAVYWNSNTEQFDGKSKEEVLSKLKEGVADSDKDPGFQYLIRPISSVAHLRLNTKPELNKFTIPKVFLTIVFDDIAVGLSKIQYDDVLEMLESLERLNLQSKYRKYRPDVPHKGHAKHWWHYAMNSILEEDIRRKRKMWAWSHIKQHRQTMKQYRKAYIDKLESKKISKELQKTIDNCEMALDVFSITLMRQEAEVEAAKRGAKKAQEKSEGGWFGGWFGGKKKEKKKEGEEEFKDKFQEQFTLEEKEKLYSAIGYHENEADPSLPKEYVAIRLVTKLTKMSLTLRDDTTKDAHVLKAQLKDVFSSVGQRPAANAIQVEAKMDKFTVQGTPQNGQSPNLALSQTKEADQVYSLLNVGFETNPLDGECDTRVKVNSRPVQIIYDAVTINNLAKFFKPPEEVFLQQLSQAALAKFEEIKEQSATGLQHAIEQRKYTEITVDLQPSYVIIPDKGYYKKENRALILDLGNLKVSTEKNQSKFTKGQGIGSVEEIMMKAYDKFNITLDRIQVLFSSSGEEWKVNRKQPKSPMHILEPISINVVLQKSMFDNDPRMAKMKVSGELPLLSMNMSDKKLQDLIGLIDSIPLPETSSPDQQNIVPLSTDLVELDDTELAKKALIEGQDGKVNKLEKSVSEEYINYTDLELKFEIKQVDINVSQVENGKEIPVLRLVVASLGTQVTIHTYDMKVAAYLGGVYLQHRKFVAPPGYTQTGNPPELSEGPVVNIINTPGTHEDAYLLEVHYLKADKNGPEFSSTHNNTEQKIDVTFTSLEVLLHQEALLHVIELAEKLKPAPKTDTPSKSTDEHKDKKSVEEKKDDEKKVVKKKKTQSGIIDLQLDAVLHEFQVILCTEEKFITDVRIKDINAGVTMETGMMTVTASLTAISILDPTHGSFYPRIMDIQEGEKVLTTKLVIYDDATKGDNYSNLSNVDTSVEVSFGCVKLVFLNRFVSDILSFLNKFLDGLQDQVNQAKEMAAEYSKDVAQKLQERAPRVSLNVKMKAPVIIIPQNSKSKNALVADFGSLSVTNSFSKAGENENNVPYVLDNMVVELTSLKMSRAVVNRKMDVHDESLIIEPVTITVKVIRNLSAENFNEVPAIDISGKMKSVCANLSQYDYAQIMTTLNENLTEGQMEIIGPAEIQLGELSDKEVMESHVLPPPLSRQPSEELSVKLKFNFEIESLSATLYMGEQELMAKRDPKTALGKVELQVIAVTGKQMSDESMEVKVILKDTVVDDSRSHKIEGITRMIQRSSSGAGGDSNMIDVMFKQDACKDSNVDVKVHSLYICVCLDYLMFLADFFTKGLPQKDKTETVKSENKAKAAKSKKKEPAELPPPPQSCMDIVVKVEKPEIILIEDQLNPNCNCLVLDTEVLFKMKIHPESQDMSANVKDFQVFACQFSQRGSVAAQILNPCDISFYSKTPYGKGAHMDIATSDLILNISPATIKTIVAISSAITAKPGSEDEHTKKPIPADLWEIKKLSDTDFWFLKSAEEVIEDPDLGLDDLIGEEDTRSELLIAKIPVMVIKIEGGVGKRTVPLLIVESSFSGEVKDWSSKLSVESTLKLEVAYYNEKLSVWEPLVEPIMDNGKFKRWELGLEVMMNDDLPPPPQPEEDGDSVDVPALPPPKMSVTVFSHDEMQLTMSKTCLEVLQNLGKAFGDAYYLVEPTEKAGEVLAPFCIQNHTGLEIMMKLDNSFEMPKDSENNKIKMTPERQLELWGRSKKGLIRKASVIKAAQEGDEKKFIFQIEKFNVTREVNVKRAEKRLYQINHKTYPGDVWSIVVITETPIGQKILKLQSMVEIQNHFEIDVEVFYKNDLDVTSCGIVKAGSLFSLPLHAVYTPEGLLLFKPLTKNYKTSKETVSWRGADNLGTVQLSCEGEAGHSPFYISVRPEVENVYFDVGEQQSAKTYIFHLSPTVILHNLLPLPINFLVEGTEEHATLQKGRNTALLNACVGTSNIEIVLPHYDGKEWVGRRVISKDLPELSMLTFEAYDGAQKVLMNLGIHCKRNEGCMDVSVYCPYWMVNKTEQDLFYKPSDSDDFVTHRSDNKDIVLFSFKQKNMFGTKKKASLKIATSEWSDKFSLDTVGSSGDIQCKGLNKRIFTIGVKIQLSSSALTKICTFTPFYMLLNMSETAILCQETQEQDWIEVSAKQCLPFWPVQSGKEMTMKAKFAGSEAETSQFNFNKEHVTLMKLSDQHGGINVDCQLTEVATVVTFNEYCDGMATVLLINDTDRGRIHFHQSGLKTEHVLNPQQYMLYTWENATGKREIIWSYGEKNDQKNDLQQDGIGEFFANADSKIYWVSFLDGMQRVMLFTEDLALATIAQEAGELERIEQEISVCIQGLGLSLVNDYKQKEVAYIGITSSGIVWEEKKRRRFRALNVKTGEILEKGYQKYATELEMGHTPPTKLHLENKLEVDFNEMMMYKPNKRMIKRSFQEGIWIQYKTSPHQIQLHAKIQRLQLDNQMGDATFPTVLSPTPLAKSIAAESIPKPFTELSMMLRKHEHSKMLQFKYFKVLTQEMTLKVDQGFINEMIELFASAVEVSRDQETTLLEEDYKQVHVSLLEDAGLSLANEQKNFYDYLHFSPIKVHLSFSLQSRGSDGKTAIKSDVINIFLQSVGVVLTDVQDVVFKLAFFQREHKFYNQSQLTGEMTRHYASQAIKQMYVLVLGLDVLGNPFGLIRGMAEGIEDLFYEPYQGAIQGPEEFAEGLALGVRSLFGHAVGGAAGAVSRITGALGKGIATLTLDDEYQKKRREAMNKRPANVREGFARGGKGLVMGVFDGVTGIVRKPIEGAQSEGVGGFFKGLGKGLVGVVTRPTSGVIDFASSSFEGIKRIADMSVDVHRLRNPRIFSAERIIRPYNRREADGYMILQETEKGKFAVTDHYVGHGVISRDGRHVLLVTDKRVIYANRGEIFGHWDCEWSNTWGEIKDVPKRSHKGIEITLREKEKKKFAVFGSSSAKKDVVIHDPNVAEFLLVKISEAMNRHK